MAKFKKMKKIILLITTIVGFYNANAQCVPGTKVVVGADGYIIPDSATGMAHGCAGMAYNETFYIMAPKDTTISGFPLPIPIDSIIINLDPVSMGLPSYLTLASVPAALPANSVNNFLHLKIPGNTLACIKVAGTVPAGTVAGSTSLNIQYVGYAFTLSSPGAYTAYKIVVDAPGTGACAVAINDINKNIGNVKVVPNPAQNSMMIEAMAENNEKVTIQIINAIGQTTHSKSIDLRKGDNYIPFDVQSLPAGIYLYQIRNAKNQILSGKFSKN
jgi:Secretion system C-terminal sorting domain